MENPGFNTTLPMLPALIDVDALESKGVLIVTELVTGSFANLTPVIVTMMLCGPRYSTIQLDATLFIVVVVVHKSASDV